MKKTTELYAFAETTKDNMTDQMDANDNVLNMLGKALRDIVNESADPSTVELGSTVFRKIATNKNPNLTEGEIASKEAKVTTQFNAVKQAIDNVDTAASNDEEKTQNLEKLVKAVREMYHASDSSERNDSFTVADLETKSATFTANPAIGRPKVVYIEVPIMHDFILYTKAKHLQIIIAVIPKVLVMKLMEQLIICQQFQVICQQICL